ncbi:MAG: class I SAM-dependent methyltransferase [Lachnospira sp.]|nr:class I SAM-dependent methyltransferase [Lachnospira sp.]
MMERLKISKRLQTAAELVKPGNRVADIGTDHGYLPVYLVKEGISSHVIAMDVRKGPLSKAEKNIADYGISQQVDLRLSDGLVQLNAGEVDTITICGMGGRLMKQILMEGKEKLTDGMQLILSPQSELAEFRIYLKNNYIHIMDEQMLEEDHQYYVMMDCRYDELQQLAEEQYGKILLEKQDPVLKNLLMRELELNHRIMSKLQEMEEKQSVQDRCQNLKKEEAVIQKALSYYR